jgi:N-acyl-D-amino-acid deacylase
MCKDFEAYGKLLTQNRIGVNVVSLVGHGQIRLYVMAGYEQRGATLEQIQQMCQLLELQLLQGSSGLSLGMNE